MATWGFLTEQDCRYLASQRNIDSSVEVNPADNETAGQQTASWQQLAKHAGSLSYEHGGGKLPRHHVWRTYRLMFRGEVLAATAIQHSKWHNCLNVDGFITAGTGDDEHRVWTRAAVLFLLSDAFKSGGTMQLRFMPSVNRGSVPDAMVELARSYGIEFANANQGIVSPHESIQLYLELSEFSPQAKQRIEQLNDSGLLSIPRACYLLHHQIWSRDELEQLLISGPYPDLILGKRVEPLFRHLDHYARQHMRHAIMGGMLGRVLRYREQSDQGNRVRCEEGDQWHWDSTYDATMNAVIFQSMESIPLMPPSWAVDNEWPEMKPNTRLVAILRAASASKLVLQLSDDLQVAAKRKIDAADETLAIVVPFDYWTLASSVREEIQRRLKSANIYLAVCPDSISGLDAEVRKRLSQSAAVRA